MVKRTGKNGVKRTQLPRSEGNPFHQGSSYGAGYEILKAHPAGLSRQEFIKLLAKATGKSEKRAGYDAAVVLSARTSPTGPRHQSCREGFWVEREGDHCLLRTA